MNARTSTPRITNLHTNTFSVNRSRTVSTLCLSLLAIALTLPLPATTTEPQQATPIQWVDLLPEPEKRAFNQQREKLIAIPPMPDLGSLNTDSQSAWLERRVVGSKRSVSTHNAAYVELVGYPIPLQQPNHTEDAAAFLLVPELGAGLVLPAPPPNQTVRVNPTPQLISQKGEAPPPDLPIRIRGILKQLTDNTEQTGLPYAYVIEADAWSW